MLGIVLAIVKRSARSTAPSASDEQGAADEARGRETTVPAAITAEEARMRWSLPGWSCGAHGRPDVARPRRSSSDALSPCVAGLPRRSEPVVVLVARCGRAPRDGRGSAGQAVADHPEEHEGAAGHRHPHQGADPGRADRQRVGGAEWGALDRGDEEADVVRCRAGRWSPRSGARCGRPGPSVRAPPRSLSVSCPSVVGRTSTVTGWSRLLTSVAPSLPDALKSVTAGGASIWILPR